MDGTIRRTVMIGGSGHALVCADLLADDNSVLLEGYVSADTQPSQLTVPRLGDDSALDGLLGAGVTHAFVGVGDNAVRRTIIERLRSLGFQLVNAVSNRAVIAPSVVLADGVAVMAGSVINAGAQIGSGAIINTGATVDHDCVIGAYCHLAPGVHLAGWVSLGEGAMMGIGSAAIPRMTVGEWAMIGAGATVVRPIPENATAVGTPARVVSTTATRR
jgi:UDP-perosamine 4-acetyltransferase